MKTPLVPKVVLLAVTLAAITVVSLMGPTRPAYAQSKYKFIRLGGLGTAFSSGGFGVNDNGHVVGSSGPTGGNWYHAFHWSDANGDGVFQQSEMKDLGTFGGTHSQAKAINNANQVVGWAYPLPDVNGTQDVRAFIWKPGDPALTDLNTLVDTSSVPAGQEWVLRQAHDINDSGVIVARAWHTVTNADGSTSTTDRSCILTPSGSGLYGITGLSVAGSSTFGSVSSNSLAVMSYNGISFFWDGATETRLSVTGRAVNAAGAITGQAVFGSLNRACLLTSPSSAPLNLGTLGGNASNGWDINDASTVVGYSYMSTKPFNETQHAFRWQAGTGMMDLNNFVTRPKTAKWYLVHAYSISQNGLISGVSGGDGGDNRAFLMIPTTP